MPKILAVVVTYNPDVGHLEKLLDVLLHQVEKVLVIDNNSAQFHQEQLNTQSHRIEFILNDDNVGLATAYNQACSIAKELEFSHIILFDQDSLPATNMVDALLAAMTQRNQNELVAAAAGPKYHDKKGQKLSPFVRIKDFHLERVDCAENEVVEIDHLISSGSLIDLRAIDYVGNFIDELFIDCVDTEWCLRARHRQLVILGVGNATMQHNIGEAYLNVFGRQLPMHTPIRLYYQFRNQLWIMKQHWVGWRWRIVDGLRCIKLLIVYVLFAPNKIKNISYILKGLAHGIRSHMGKLSD